MLGYGLRDSVRLAIRPGTSEVWVADRGGGYWEEFNRVHARPSRAVQNFGWPCYEGGIDASGNPYNAHPARERRAEPEHLREPLQRGQPDGRSVLGLRPRAAGRAGRDLHAGLGRLARREPGHRGVVLSRCRAATSRPRYRGALFFSDRLRDCIYALLPGPDGLPQRGNVVLFAAGAMRPMDIEVLPGGDMLYVDQQNNAGAADLLCALRRRTRRPPPSRPRARPRALRR